MFPREVSLVPFFFLVIDNDFCEKIDSLTLVMKCFKFIILKFLSYFKL